MPIQQNFRKNLNRINESAKTNPTGLRVGLCSHHRFAMRASRIQLFSRCEAE